MTAHTSPIYSNTNVMRAHYDNFVVSTVPKNVTLFMTVVLARRGAVWAFNAEWVPKLDEMVKLIRMHLDGEIYGKREIVAAKKFPLFLKGETEKAGTHEACHLHIPVLADFSAGDLEARFKQRQERFERRLKSAFRRRGYPPITFDYRFPHEDDRDRIASYMVKSGHGDVDKIFKRNI